MTSPTDGRPRPACARCGVAGRILRRVGTPGDPGWTIAICPGCDGPAHLVRPEPAAPPRPPTDH